MFVSPRKLMLYCHCYGKTVPGLELATVPNEPL